MISNHAYDFGQKLHATKFNYHFITSMLKSHNLIAQIQDFSQYQCFIDPAAGLQKKKGSKSETLLNLILYAKQPCSSYRDYFSVISLFRNGLSL